MAKKIPIGVFVSELRRALDEDCGYIMGSKGQDPKRWAADSWWYTQYSGKQREKALYWRRHAPRVYDCNGLAEGIYQAETDVDINTKARFNYSGWCNPHGDDMDELPKISGAAVFIHSRQKGYITHVGYLDRPVKADKPDGDWYVIEARGVMYGVVRTRLSERGWNRWGLMTKYFDYGDIVIPPASDYELGERLVKRGMSGADVRQIQEMLIDAGYSCGRYGADGEFGGATLDAVKAFQEAVGLDADGIVGEKTLAALKGSVEEDGDEEEKPEGGRLVVIGGSVNVRSAPTTAGSKIICTVHRGDVLEATGVREGSWHEIWRGNERVWISGKYVA